MALLFRIFEDAQTLGDLHYHQSYGIPIPGSTVGLYLQAIRLPIFSIVVIFFMQP